MGSINRNALVDRLKFILGNRTNVDNELITWIQDAYRELFTRNNLPLRQSFQQVTTLAVPSGGNSVTIDDITLGFEPHSVAKLRLVDPDRWLNFLTPQPWHMLDQQATPATPTHYTRFQEKIFFWPRADLQYNLDILFRRYPTDLDTGTQRIIFDDVWVRPLVALAASMALDDLGEERRAATYFAKHEAALIRIQTGLEGDQSAEGGGLTSLVEEVGTTWRS